MLDEEHRIVVTDGRLEQSLASAGVRRDDLQARKCANTTSASGNEWRPVVAATTHVRITNGSESGVEHVVQFAAWLTIWSMARKAKLMVMISATGRKPAMAARRQRQRSLLRR